MLDGNATFMPGTYVLTSSHGANGLGIHCGATVSGNGVTFYNYGPFGSINFTASSLGGKVNLKAPTSGTYSGVLFYQDPGNTTPATILGTNGWSTVLGGAYYFPSAIVNFAFDGSVDYSLLIAKDINFLGLKGIVSGANNLNNFSGLGGGSPLQKTIPALVQCWCSDERDFESCPLRLYGSSPNHRTFCRRMRWQFGRGCAFAACLRIHPHSYD